MRASPPLLLPADPPAPKLFPLGDAAIVLEFGHEISAATHRTISAFSAHLERHPFAGLREYVPGFTTLTVYYDPWLVSEQGQFPPYRRVEEWLLHLLTSVPPPTQLPPAVVVEIPVCYGGAHGPDLEFVAQHTGLTPEEVIVRHAAPTYLVHLIGFVPGFPYLGGLDPQLATPRKAVPRALVPAGAVGIAGAQTGIYPLPTPGGWQLIGRTPLTLFNAAWDSPSRLQAGHQLRFTPISEAEFDDLAQRAHTT